MNALDAICRVLNEAGKPLHYLEILRRMLRSGLWSTTGATPERTINAMISQEIAKQGKNSRFTRVGPGTYGLTTRAVAAGRATRGPASSAVLPRTPVEPTPAATRSQTPAAVEDGLALVKAAWANLSESSKRAVLDIVERSRQPAPPRDPIVAEVLPNGPKAFPADFLAADVTAGANVELPNESIEVVRQSDGTDVVRSHFGFAHRVRNTTEGRYILYAHLRGHRTVQVPEKMIHVFKAVKAYEKYLRDTWQDLFRAYGRRNGQRTVASGQANEAFASLCLPSNGTEVVKEEVPVEVNRSGGKRRRRGLRTPETGFYLPVLQALIEMGGSGRTADVIERVGVIMNGRLNAVDRELLSSTGMPRWDTSVRFARMSMARIGLLGDGSRHGVWEITDKGRDLFRQRQGQAGSPGL